MSALLDSRPRFRPLTPDDLGRVVEIEGRIYEFPWSAGNFRDSLLAGYSCWACELSGMLVGYGVLMAAGEDAHLLNVSIASGWQGRGIGRALVAHFVQVARDHHARIVFLEVRPSNEVARSLYASMGFEQIGIRRDYYPARHGREDAIILRLIL
jgi:[ribosomal protein S18]-alanine N-acetyltransferase